MKGKAEKNRKSRFLKGSQCTQGRSVQTKLKFVTMGKKTVAFRCLEIRLGFRNEQAFCVHHNRLTGRGVGEEGESDTLRKCPRRNTSRSAMPDNRSGGQKGEKGEGRRSSIGGGGGDGRPREHFLSRGVQCRRRWRRAPSRLRPQLKGSFLLPSSHPPTPPPHTHPSPPPSRLHAFAELSEQIPTIPAVEKPSLAPPEVASKKKRKKKKSLTNPHSALKRDTFCQTGERERESGRKGERGRQSSEDMETLLRQNIAKIAGKKT